MDLSPFHGQTESFACQNKKTVENSDLSLALFMVYLSYIVSNIISCNILSISESNFLRIMSASFMFANIANIC